MPVYDSIGASYTRTRKSDPRIAQALLSILNLPSGSTVADIGAGTGSYASVLADAGHQVVAVEPSSTMRNQATPHADVQWIEAYAEALPLPDASVDAAVVMLAFHHFQEPLRALHEIYRITAPGKMLLFTYDPEMIAHFWLINYFPAFVEDVRSTFLPLSSLASKIEAITTRPVKVEPFALPHDLLDSFAAVGWGRPELYLDDRIRNGISSFSKMTDSELSQGLSKLRKDIGMGLWDKQYGHLRRRSHYDAGYRFLYTTNSPA